MRTRALAILFAIFAVSIFVIPAHAQDNAPSTQARNNNLSSDDESSVEGSVVSTGRETFVVRTDDNQFHLFTYNRVSVRAASLAIGSRVRVDAGAPDDNGTRSASGVTVITAAATGATSSRDQGAQAAPVPDKVKDIEADIKRESRRWRLGVRTGAAFDPELFTFGVQSQIGPILHPRVLFRPNAEFAFGEVTDLIALNLEAIYRFSSKQRRGDWTPYVGAGPAMIFIHQSYQAGRQIDFGNFDYETGLNVLAGLQSRRGTFVELKTSLYSGPAPKMRVIVGYNF